MNTTITVRTRVSVTTANAGGPDLVGTVERITGSGHGAFVRLDTGSLVQVGLRRVSPLGQDRD